MGDFKRKSPDRKHPKFGVYDIETDINDDSIFACGFYDGMNYWCFQGDDCAERFIGFIYRSKYGGYTFYAHNGGRFDTTFLMPAFRNLGIRTESAFSGGRMIILSIAKRRMPITFADSYALMQGSLLNLLSSFGVEHQKGEIDFKNIRKSDEWIPYLENDVMGLHELLEIFWRFFSPWNAGLGITISQQAMSTFRRTIDYRIPAYPELEGFIRQAYFGGRVEVFKRFGENLFYYDFNSLYPDVMRNNEMPVGKPTEVQGDRYADDEIGFAKAVIKAPDGLRIPILGYKNNGKLIFPLGRFSGVWDVAELRKAQDYGYEVAFKNGVKFSGMPMFKDYVDIFYKMKEDNRGINIPKFTLAKLSSTSLYGKFGESREKESVVMLPDDIAGLVPISEKLGIYGKSTYSHSTHILPAIATHVTALARNKLLEGFERVGFDNLFYSDSVSGDTPIFIRRQSKFIDLMEIQELNPTQLLRYNRWGSGFNDIEVMSRNGWTKINYVYKHKTDKPIYVLSGNIYCKVTGDHSIFQSGKEVKVNQIHAGDRIDQQTLPDLNEYDSITEDFAKVLGFFVAEGSCGAYDTKHGIKYSWALTSQDSDRLRWYGNILEGMFNIKFKVLQTMESSNVLKLVPAGGSGDGYGMLRDITNCFARICYTKSGNKKVPSVILNSSKSVMKSFLDGYMEGDGCYVNKGYDKDGQKRNDSISFILQSGISFISKILGFGSTFLTRKDKPSVITHIQTKKNGGCIRKIIKIPNSDYVYDISTNDGTFVGGCGLIIFHNTDSIISSKELETSNRLGGLKLEHRIIKGYFIAPKFYYLQTAQLGDFIQTPMLPMMQAVNQEMKSIIKIKGFPNPKFTEQCFEKALRNDLSDFHYNERVFGLMRENVRNFDRFIGRIDRKKQIKSLYDKRVVCRNHIDTTPLIINSRDS